MTPPTEKETWIEEFNEVFNVHTIDVDTAAQREEFDGAPSPAFLKAFIGEKIAQARQKERERIVTVAAERVKGMFIRRKHPDGQDLVPRNNIYELLQDLLY